VSRAPQGAPRAIASRVFRAIASRVVGCRVSGVGCRVKGFQGWGVPRVVRGGPRASAARGRRARRTLPPLRDPPSRAHPPFLRFCQRNLLHNLIVLVIVKHLCIKSSWKETLFKRLKTEGGVGALGARSLLLQIRRPENVLLRCVGCLNCPGAFRRPEAILLWRRGESQMPFYTTLKPRNVPK